MKKPLHLRHKFPAGIAPSNTQESNTWEQPSARSGCQRQGSGGCGQCSLLQDNLLQRGQCETEERGCGEENGEGGLEDERDASGEREEHSGYTHCLEHLQERQTELPGEYCVQ